MVAETLVKVRMKIPVMAQVAPEITKAAVTFPGIGNQGGYDEDGRCWQEEDSSWSIQVRF